ncbi:MAG: hypothetical protein WC489_03865 [Patescibacteria group bacterium]
MDTGLTTQTSDKSPQKTLFVIAGIGLGLILISIAAVFYFFSFKKTGITNKPTPIVSDKNDRSFESLTGNTKKTVVDTSPLPEPDFKSWVNKSPSKPFSLSLKTYTLKQNYTTNEVKTFAQKLGITSTVKQDGDTVLAYDQNKTNVAILIFETITGKFSFATAKGLPLFEGTSDKGSLDENVYAFLKKLNIYDSTLKVSATYKKKTEPGVLFVEVHRDWDAVGGAILNPIGLLNIPETQPFATLSLKSSISNLPSDQDIYATSDYKDGFIRQDDFNTLTLAIKESDNKILSVVSNIRVFSSTPSNTNQPLAYEDAYEKLKKGNYQLFLTTPSGDGQTSFDKVYPQHIARANEAVVTESTIAFLEKPSPASQTVLEPYYLFRGYADLASGYRTNFVAAVFASASNMPQAFIQDGGGQVAGAVAGDDPTQKQGNVDFFNTPTSTPSAGSSSSSSSSSSTSDEECVPSEADLDPIHVVNGMKFGWSTKRPVYRYNGIVGGILPTQLQLPTRPAGGNPDVPGMPLGFWFFVPPPSLTKSQLEAEYETIKANLQSVVNVESSEFRRIVMVLMEFEGRGGGVCPLRITGPSPSLFIYGKEGQKISVSIRHPLTYADPAVTNTGWYVTIGKNNKLTINNMQRDFIYYEYRPIEFSRPTTGWNIAKNDITSFVESRAKELQLTAKEKERLKFEISNAASNIQSTNLFIGLIPQQEVDEKLPIQVSEKPQSTYRYHFYVGYKNEETQKPVLPAIKRSEFMIVEIGAVTE